MHSPADQFRHDLKTPLTTIYARAHLLARSIRRSPTLSAEEQVTMLAGVTTIEAAVREMTTRIDATGRESPSGPGDLG